MLRSLDSNEQSHAACKPICHAYYFGVFQTSHHIRDLQYTTRIVQKLLAPLMYRSNPFRAVPTPQFSWLRPSRHPPT